MDFAPNNSAINCYSFAFKVHCVPFVYCSFLFNKLQAFRRLKKGGGFPPPASYSKKESSKACILSAALASCHSFHNRNRGQNATATTMHASIIILITSFLLPAGRLPVREFFLIRSEISGRLPHAPPRVPQRNFRTNLLPQKLRRGAQKESRQPKTNLLCSVSLLPALSISFRIQT